MTADRKALNQWARCAGYNDFDTYIRAGHSILDARHDIAERIAKLQSAMQALDSYHEQPKPIPAEPTQPTDTANAQIQGDDPV